MVYEFTECGCLVSDHFVGGRGRWYNGFVDWGSSEYEDGWGYGSGGYICLGLIDYGESFPFSSALPQFLILAWYTGLHWFPDEYSKSAFHQGYLTNHAHGVLRRSRRCSIAPRNVAVP